MAERKEMETLEAILSRRSIRKYSQEPIHKEEIDKILKAALSAPSGLNLQPWYLVMVTSDEKRKELTEIMNKVSEGIIPELQERFPTKPDLVASTSRFISTLGDAPAILLAFMMRDDYADMRTAMISVCAAVQNAVIEARSLGIGSCWLTAAEQTGFNPVIREHFAPDKGDLVAIVTLGYPEKWPKPVPPRDGRFTIV